MHVQDSGSQHINDCNTLLRDNQEYKANRRKERMKTVVWEVREDWVTDQIRGREEKEKQMTFMFLLWLMACTVETSTKVGNTGYIPEMFRLACFKPNQQTFYLILWFWIRYLALKKMYFVLVVGKLAISSVPTTELRNLQTMEHLV